MIKYKFADVVLVVFPQPDGSKKQRPALVILDIGDDDIVLAPVTSRNRDGKGDIDIKNAQRAGLITDSWLRLAKLSSLSNSNCCRQKGSNFVLGKTV